MSFLGEMLNGLYGAYRLLRLDPRGMAFFNISEEGFWNSFKAAAIVFPLFSLLILVRYATDTIATPLWRYISIETIAYVIGWIAFPVVMAGVCRQYQRADRYVGFVTAYNWAAVLQNAIYLPIAILSVSGRITTGGGLLVLVTMAVIIVYNWFIAKTALEISAPAAAGVVIIDFIVSFAINMYAEALLQ